MIASFTLNMILCLIAQGPAKDTPDGRLDFMRGSLEVESLRATDDPKATFTLRAEPVMRFTNPVGTVQDGAIFVWLGESGRPAAAVQVFHHNKNGNWYQEFCSLSDVPLSAGRLWGPTPAGVEFRPFPGAPKPADTPELRLRQINDLARECAAENAPEGAGKEAGKTPESFHKLRRLTKPYARYGKAETGVLDGALLAFVDGTDPEVYLLVEARRTKDGYAWHYAFAPAAIAPIKGYVRGKEVWSLPYREAWLDRNAPFYVGWFARS
ncbi:hypothetical protein [Paludisphaera borealis]|uniref:Uncharacterized protein n=1 Tax=Paludisphaera borealis TaxID=1387353 RepID=A0A1U7CJQ9_9BACT|nr:hypothetical protein [Paludisphaera borealis]APW59171.1 hypothetical protein BSF38_00585 [Paludisphaera borealis]